jgi:hypothetical protein
LANDVRHIDRTEVDTAHRATEDYEHNYIAWQWGKTGPIPALTRNGRPSS